MLTAGAVNELIRELRSPDVTAARTDELKSEIIAEHQGLIHHFIRLYDVQVVEDLVQLGTIGVLAAIDKFDLDRQVAFATFAGIRIRGEISHYLRDNATIRIPRSVQSHIKVVRTAQDTFVAQHNQLPTFVQLAIHADLNRSELFDAMQANQSTHLFSLDDPETYLDIPATQSEYEFVDEWASVRPAIDQLAPLERKILGMRFIEQKRQGEIAQELGMNQMAVSRRLNSILERLRHHVTAV